MSDHVVIVAAKRTPVGAFMGALSGATAVQLGAAAIKGALEAAGLAGKDVQEVIMGCVLPAVSARRRRVRRLWLPAFQLVRQPRLSIKCAAPV